MKTIFAICGLILLVGGVLLWRSMNAPFVAGEFTGAPKAEVKDVIEHPKDHLGKTVSLEGTVTKQCTTMGCYFFLLAGDKELRVDLADIAMNAPMGKNGHHVKVEGRTKPFDQGYEFFASALELQ
ncbi:MAG: DUF4920 domain-containing protein [Deltaproteobacteria bacterium]|nr:DUF4920 domain-containing protein [Deltaproteobacteria bacterium]